MDPAQNSSFLDHYLDVGFDLSKGSFCFGLYEFFLHSISFVQVLFVCTANTIDTIPGPLLDRMEVMRLSGYIQAEKMEIAKRYLLPKSQKESGIGANQVKITDEALSVLIGDYAREAGVRNLEKLIDKIYRKAAYKLVSGANKVVHVTTKKVRTKGKKKT